MKNTIKPQSAMLAFAIEVVRALRQREFTALFAGGCVRDQLLYKTPKDFDIATDAKPEQVREVFGHKRTLAIGASFGVITVLGKNGLQVEVATFRNDGQYLDGRHPTAVTFSTAEEDAKRRDFTINGMFYDPLRECVIDYVNGQHDLREQVIRAIGEPLERISEDRLRMLRAVRFAATYGFTIEPRTLESIQSQAQHLSAVSQERITHELLRMLGHQNRSVALQLLRTTNLLPTIVPLTESLISDETWQRLLTILGSAAITSHVVAIAILLGPVGLQLDVKAADAMCRKWKLSNNDRKSVIWIIENRRNLEAATTLQFSVLQPLLVHPQISLALEYLEAVRSVRSDLSLAIQHCNHLLTLPPEELNPPLLLRGDDLKGIGLKPGPQFAKLLRLIRNEQLDGSLTSREAAIAFVRDHLPPNPPTE